jgi:hypothetical protein
MNETAKKSSSDLESKVETIINHRSEELCDKNSSNQDKMNHQSLDKLTSHATFYFEDRKYKVFLQPSYHDGAFELEDIFN